MYYFSHWVYKGSAKYSTELGNRQRKNGETLPGIPLIPDDLLSAHYQDSKSSAYIIKTQSGPWGKLKALSRIIPTEMTSMTRTIEYPEGEPVKQIRVDPHKNLKKKFEYSKTRTADYTAKG
ncbi:hypothetical protein Thermo_01699 [Thermoplasmatales archaeon]|nr:hypothetical protein Thermo_01699 [Thermoplasmatales archaeon]